MPMRRLFLPVFISAMSLTAYAAAAGDPSADHGASATCAERPASARSQNSSQAQADDFAEYRKKHAEEFTDYKERLQAEFKAYKNLVREETQRYQSQLSTVWDEPELSTQKVWVDYSGDLKSRNKVDFENETITVTKTVPKGQEVSSSDFRQQLAGLICKNQAEAFEDDAIAQAVEKRSKEKLTLLETAKVQPTPILMPLVTDEVRGTKQNPDAIADELLKQGKRSVSTNKKGMTVVSMEVPLKPPHKESNASKASTPDPKREPRSREMADVRVNKLPAKAREIWDHVVKYSNAAEMNKALVLAIIETESAFNPMAKSHIPAYGLMQIVPTSAGIDATKRLFGKGRVLAPSYLYARDKNIEVGATYLNILFYSYLKGIDNPLSRLYCTIAAYNTGAGNVAKAFTGTNRLRDAVPKINEMEPQEVYQHLIKNLPYEETRNYLKKVASRMPKYMI